MEHELEPRASTSSTPDPAIRAGAARPRLAPRRGPGRARALTVSALACIAIAGGAVVAVGYGGTVAKPAEPEFAALSAAEIDTMLMPIDAADVRASMRLGDFESTVVRNAANTCEGVARVSAPVAPIPANARLRLYEDPAVLRASGFGIVANLRTELSEKASASVPSRECMQVGRAAVNRIESLVAPIRDSWIRTVQSTETGPAVQAAWASWSSCMKSAGYALEDEDGFNRLVDSTLSKLVGAGDVEGARAAELTLARAFADCLGDVVQARGQARGVARASLVSSRGAEIAAVRSGLNGEIREAGRRNEVSFG